jgi:hypothetical protein
MGFSARITAASITSCPQDRWEEPENQREREREDWTPVLLGPVIMSLAKINCNFMVILTVLIKQTGS